jgi:hypothetical protein
MENVVSHKKVWFITAASRGMGADFAKAALAAAHSRHRRAFHQLQVLFSTRASPRFYNIRPSDGSITASATSVATGGAIDRTLHPMAFTALRSI